MKPLAKILEDLSAESLDKECHQIAKWWMDNSLDTEYGGFVGEIDFFGGVVPKANKGIILNTRILWFFSEAAKHFDKLNYRQIADRAYQYLLAYFDDKESGGVVWELDHQGVCVNGKKQTYAQAFAIYGLAAYYRLSQNQTALTKAIEYFEVIERFAIDPQFGGYLEAFAQDWGGLEDVRLSEKDLNSPKSMNTHIHILEAYTCLVRISGEQKVKDALKNLIQIIFCKILNANTYHLSLFQDIDWRDQSTSISYGHDIECSWLLWDALEALGDTKFKAKYRSTIIKIAEVCLVQAIGEQGQVCDQLTFVDNKRHPESFWWVQAEALVGFLNAFQLTGEPAYLKACEKIWRFTQEQHIDHEHGEWHWLAVRDQKPAESIYKAGFWKGPYHNGRAMMEAAVLLRLHNGEVKHEVVN
jgi:mannobiose 2-epimerase